MVWGFYPLIFIFKSILKAIDFFLKVLTINDFSVFHIIIFLSFNDFINNIFRIILNQYKNYHWYLILIIIITFSFEIFAIFIFVEVIELNCCDLNLNLKKNIIFRADRESNLIYQIKEEEEENKSDNELVGESEQSNDNNSVY